MLQAGQQIGPFTIEKEIGAGAMGAVYRGIYQPAPSRPPIKVAIKIMLPGAAEHPTSAKRFLREVEILKQLIHPNIVRLLGDGKHQGQRYYAMEYIQGESMDRVLARRGRLSWEEVVQLGKQLCAALAHAHEKGVVHRDLKPSNLMILPDGTLKLTDFGIAKDLDVTQLTEAHCTVGTASYMSPEQCRGEREINHKSDLYSLGIVFYELITGRKPFLAENVMDMFMLHVKGTFERPSRLVDIPKWLDILVCQLMEKDPERRPLNAAKVGEALEEVLEKVEARQSAGVEAARTRGPGRPRDEQDRDAALALIGKKKKKKKDKRAWYQKAWVKAVGVLIPLLAVAFVIWLVLKPPSAEALYEKIEKRMKVEDFAVKKGVYEGPITEYLRRHGNRDDDRTRQVLKWKDEIGVMLAEEDLLKTAERTKTISIDKMDALRPAEKKAVLAVLAENEGDIGKARRLWEEIVREHGNDPGHWASLAAQRLAFQLSAVKDLTAQLTRHLNSLLEFAREPDIADAVEKKAFTARRFEEIGDRHEARVRWEALKKETQEDVKRRSWFLLAASRVSEIRPEKTDDETRLRIALVKDRLAEAKKERAAGELRKAEVLCLHVIALYPAMTPERDFAPLVEEAKKLKDDILKQRGLGEK